MRRNRSATSGSARRAFWLPALNYYTLAGGLTVAFFFAVWGSLPDGSERYAALTAGLASGTLILILVALREVFMRSARHRLIASERLDRTLQSVKHISNERDRKLTLERNAGILREITKKSDAAKVLRKFADGHREVFEMCEDYMAVATKELSTVRPGSPRLVALQKGKNLTRTLHRYHLLKWAELRTHSLTQAAGKNGKISEKLKSAREALDVVGFALVHYPQEPKLLESQAVLKELITTVQVSDLIERAERAKSKGNHDRAVGFYKDALFHLENDPANRDGAAAGRIAAEIEKISSLQAAERP